MASLSPNVDIHSLSGGESSSDTFISTGDTGVRTFALSPCDSVLAVADLRGKVVIARLTVLNAGSEKSYLSSNVEASFSGLVQQAVAMRAGEEQDMGCKLAWSPNTSAGHLLAVPSSMGACVLCVNSGSSWEELNLCAGDASAEISHGDAGLNLAAFSADGKHLATADVTGKVVVWEINAVNPKSSKAVRCYMPAEGAAAPLLDVAWGQSSGDNYLLLSSTSACVRVEGVVLPKAAPAPAAAASMGVHSAAPGKATKEKEPRRLVKSASAALEDSDEELEEEPSAAATAAADVTGELESISAIKKSHQPQYRNAVVLDEGEEEDVLMQMQEDGDIEDEWAATKGGATLAEVEDRLAGLEEAKHNAAVDIQEPFQPSDTKPDDKQRRYLVWNSIGSITLREEADINQNRVEIRFADTRGSNKQEAFADTDGFVMAALSHEGAIFATPLEILDEDTASYRAPQGSKVHYHAFPAQARMSGANETFTIDLLEGEEATNVAVGTGWCAVATTKGMLRVFSSTGVQTNVFWLKGPAVTLTGSGTQLCVFYNASQPVNGTVQIKMDAYALFWDAVTASRCTVADLAVPLTRLSTLQWVGFETDTQCVSILDSAGMLSVLMRNLGWQWLPILDVERAKKSPDHTYWPVTVKRDKLAYVLLNGESRPAIYPQPVVATRALRIPVAEVRDGKDKGEASNQRAHDLLWAQTLTSHYEAVKTAEDVYGQVSTTDLSPDQLDSRFDKQQIEADKTVLKMFQDACRVHNLPKALSLAHMLRTEKAMYAGTQIANKFGRPTVAAKLDELVERKIQLREALAQQEQEQEQEQEEEVAAVSYAAATPAQEQEQDGYASGGEQGNYYDAAEAAAAAAGSERDGAGGNAVTPALGGAEARPHNPFKKSHHSPLKRKAGEYDVEDLKKLKASPSPTKKALLSRQSSFTETARAGRHSLNSF